MDGVHDMGGMHGFGKVEPEKRWSNYEFGGATQRLGTAKRRRDVSPLRSTDRFHL